MPTTCPNISLPEWKQLVQHLGSSGRAHAAYTLNRYQIPTPEEADALLEASAESGDKANPYSNPKIKKIKLDRVNEQIDMITNTLKNTTGDGRKLVLQKILDNLNQYKEIIEEEEPTVSVSNLTGGGEIENAERYEDFASFGNFVHFIIENLQKEVIVGRESLTSRYNRDKLYELLEAFEKTQKKPFKINSLVEEGIIQNEDDLFNMTNDILATLQGYKARGYMVLPEVSIVGKDRHGRNIIGRLDIICIAPDGTLSVLDIKTKKINSMAKGDVLGRNYPVSSSLVTDDEFRSGQRSTYDNWDIQLNIYERLLNQAGVEVNEKMILGLLYHGINDSEDGSDFDALGNSMFVYQDYRVTNIQISENNKPSDLERLRYRNFRDKVASVIPVEGSQSKKMSEEDNRAQIALNITEKEAQALLKRITEITEKELQSARQKLQDIIKTDGGKDLQDFWNERINSLIKIQQVITSKDNNWEASYRLGHIIQSLENDMKDLTTIAREIANETDLFKRASQLDKLNRAANGYNYFTDQVKSLLIAANIPSDAKAMQALNSIENAVREVSDRYNQMGLKFLVTLLKNSKTDGQVARIEEARKQAILPHIEYLKRKKAELEATGQRSGLFYRMKGSIIKDANPKSEIEQIDLQITKLEIELEGVKLNDAEISSYIESILDPNSPVYIGEGTSFFTQYLASASSSDWVLSSYANQLKIALQEGRQDYVNFIEKEKIQQELDSYGVGNSDIKDLNNPISEVRKEIVYDEDGTESTVERRSFVNPVSEEYYNIFDRHYQKVKVLLRQIKEEGDPVKKKALKAEKATLIQNHLQWRLQNTQMKLNEELYELDKLLPQDYKDARDELYEEQNLLKNSAGYNNQEYLDESTLERIAEIDVELNKLRQQYTSINNGSYARYIELREKYYEFETNYNKYEQLLSQKKIELTDQNGILDIEKLEAWKKENTIRTPKEEYHQQVSEIWEQVFDIIGATDPEIQALRDKKKEVLAQYRRRGMVDSRFMSQEDIDILDTIDQMIEDIKEGTSSDMDIMDRITLGQLFKQLGAIQKKIENPIYLKEYAQRTEVITKAWALYQAEEDEAKKDQLLEQFLLKEIDYKNWYDNNHINEYETKLTAMDAVNPLPKGFNMIDVPVDEDMMEERPGFNFTSKRLKEEAYNPNYQEDALGYPMPKGLSREGARVTGDSPWLNDKYRVIRNNSKQDAFYHKFVGRFLEMQEKTTGKMLGYYFPGYEEKSLDDYKRNGLVNGAKNRLKQFKEKNLTVHGDYDFTVNNYNTTLEDRIQFKHNKPLPIDQQTTDGIGAVIRWYEQAFVNQKAAETQPMAKSMITYMESLYSELQRSNLTDKNVRMDKLKKVIDGMNFEYGKFIKGETKEDQGKWGRIADMALQGIGITRLALDFPNQIGNLLSGNVQAFLGSHKTGLYATKNLLWAKTKIESKDGVFGSLLADYNKIGNKSFMTKMLLYFNPMQDSMDNYYDKTRSLGDRLTQGLLNGKPAFYIQDKGELEISSTIWLAIMDANRVKVIESRNPDGTPVYKTDLNGNIETINAFEAYKTNADGQVVIRDDVEWTKADEQALMKTVWSEIRRTQGNYATSDQTRAESGLTGRLLVYYRKYLAPAIKNRFGRREENHEAAEMAYGFYRGLVKSFQIYGTKKMLMHFLGAKDTGVSDFYSRKSLMAMREMIVAIGLYILGQMIKGLYDDLKDDEDSAKRTILLNMIAIYAKVDMETRSMVPLPIAGGAEEYLDNLGSFTNANRDFIRVTKALDHGIFLGMSQFTDNEFVLKRAYYQKDTGLFDEGDAKITKDIMEISGYMNIYELFNPEDRVRNSMVRR